MRMPWIDRAVAGSSLRRGLSVATLLGLLPSTLLSQDEGRPRARDIGMSVGIFQPGSWNAITDVAGVRVGHTTIIEGDRIRTGITAILPHGENLYRSRPPAAIHVGNGYGKLLGVTQVRELGEIETPILLTCTLCVWKAADAMVEWILEGEGMGSVGSINAVVGETNDGGLNDIRERPITPEHVRAALDGAVEGPVEEGSVGAGTGTRAFGWKGGIGTSSRVLPESLGGYTVGVLVQSNFGGILTMDGAPVGQELGRYSFRGDVEGPGGDDSQAESVLGTPSNAADIGRVGGGRVGPTHGNTAPNTALDARERAWLEQADGDPLGGFAEDWGQGSIMMVVATDAPLSDRNLERIARRAIMGLARTGSFAGNGSGDYVIAFSTAEGVRRISGQAVPTVEDLPNSAMSGLFQATVEATEEAIYNSLLKATTVSGMGRTADALPIDETVEVLRRYGVIGRE